MLDELKAKVDRAIEYSREKGIPRFIRDRVLDRAVKNLWRFKREYHPRFLYVNFDRVAIRQPVFILGTQGRGLTWYIV